MSESALYSELMLEATRLGHRLFRNNVGRAKYKSRSGDVYTVPYGVGGKGGSDLVGWTTVAHRVPTMTTIFSSCLFTAVECKSLTGKAKEEQEKFLNAVIKAGGIAGICRSVADYRKLVGAS